MWTAAILPVVLLGGPPVTAQDDAASSVASPDGPCAGAPYAQFDFWLGTWDVEMPDGQLAGRNVITAEESGCLVLERWTAANGSTGQSYNYFEPSRAEWRQVWVSDSAVIDYRGGPADNAAMRLTGTIQYRDGTSYPFRGEWTPQADGTVRQSFDQYNHQTQSWDSWFVGIYRPVDEPSRDDE